MPANRWFQGRLNQEDQLFRRAIPHSDEMERQLSESVRRHWPKKRLNVVELGCGTGFSTAAILRRRPGLNLTGLDNDPPSLAQARLNLRPWGKAVTLVKTDVLSYLTRARTSSVDAVASKFTLHNFERSYRGKVLRHIHRVLRPGGLFVNADKYALEGRAHTSVVRQQMIRYLDLFLPLGRRDLLQEALDHTLLDENEARLMRERQALQDMGRLGFQAIRRVFRRGMDAVYVARKQGQ
jgi:ubiquinone/menaquinone biosynthesis C-methylase UbiE